MSTPEAIKKWVIAEMKASAALVTLVGSPGPVWSAGPELPSRTGVYVRAGRSRRAERFADEARIELWCVHTASEQQCHDLMTRVRLILDAVPGEPKTWGADPSASNLRLNAVLLDEEAPPDEVPAAQNQTYWMGSLTYVIRGKSTAL